MKNLWRAERPLVLASKSASRKALLAAAGIPFEIEAAPIDERALEAPLLARGADAAEIALHLARAKAEAVAKKRPGDLVLGADQILSLDGRIFSKPADRAAAAAQLRTLSGRTHVLHSALCLVRGETAVFGSVETARLTCRPLSAQFIDLYLETAGAIVLSSVGAYQVEGQGIHLFERIEGDHATILGLPLLPLLDFLRKDGSLAG